MNAWITEPGQYDLDDASYHKDPVVGGSLSSTGARSLLPPSTPARFRWEQLHGRPDSVAFDLGRAAHTVALGVGAPIAALPFKDRRAAGWKAAAQEARDVGETPLPEPEAEQVHAMVHALRKHPIAGPLLARPGKAEQSFVGRDPETGVMCRARVDWMPDVADDARLLVVDYKTTKCAEPGAFARSMADYGYHQQGPFYCDVLSWLGLDHGLEPRFVLVAQEKTPPYLVTVASPSAQAIEWGRVLNRKARDVYRACMESGEWPGYPAVPAELHLPAWLQHIYETSHEAGAYDTAADLIGDAAA